MDQRSYALENEQIPKLLFRLSLPAIIAMSVQAMYNFVDTIFIGRGVGTLGIAAISISFPLQMIIIALAQMVGIGGGTLISRSLGAKDTQRANRALGNALLFIIIMSSTIAVFGLLFLEEILIIFGATNEILPYAKEYMSVIFIGNIFFSFGVSTNHIIRSEGNAKTAMIAMLISGGLNIIFDPIFIFGLNLGIRGAALATLLAQLFGVVYKILYFTKKFEILGISSLTFKFINLKPDLSIIKETFAVGASAFARLSASSIMAIVLNNLLGKFGGELSIATYGVINRLIMFTFLPLLGIAQGFLPIAGYNYGAKQYFRVLKVLKTSLIVVFVMGLLSYFVLMVFTPFLISIFTNDKELIEEGVWATRINVSVIFIVGVQLVGSAFFQAIGKAIPALILSMSRQILIFIPLSLILSNFFGLTGIWVSFPISDIISVLITAIFVSKEYKKIKQKI